MSTDEHSLILQTRYHELLDRYRRLSEKIAYFEKKYDDAVNAGIRFELRNEIDEEKAQRDRVEAELRKVKQEINNDKLYGALTRLDYREQEDVFIQFMRERRQIGAFLIHGRPAHGQDWLLNRLIRLLPLTNEDKEIKYDIAIPLFRRRVDTLWHVLSGHVDLNPYLLWESAKQEEAKQEIVARIYEFWQTRNVFLIIRNLNEMPPREIKEFIEDFWIRLVKIARNASNQSSDYYLLMFLLENKGSANKWDVPFAKQLDQTWEPHVPIELKRLTKFRTTVLAKWIQENNAAFPNDLRPRVQEIVQNNEDGTPLLVIEYICQLSNCKWRERGPIWMSY